VKPHDVIYDCTHDNPAPGVKYRGQGKIALPHMVLNSMSYQSIATTWGYDHLVPAQISCVTEKRLYHVFDKDQADSLSGFELKESQLSDVTLHFSFVSAHA
jgi:hypothetical protein